MKQPKKLTREQKIAVSAIGMNADNWALIKQTEFYLKIIHKTSGKTRRIDRYAIPKKGEKMNLHKATLQYCLDTYEIEGRKAIIRDGKLIGFQKEEIPAQTTNQSGDE